MCMVHASDSCPEWHIALVGHRYDFLDFFHSQEGITLAMRAKDAMTVQERRICRDRCAGMSYKAIADKRHIAISTVKTHLARVFRKRKINSSLDLQRNIFKHSEELRLEEIRAIQRKIQCILHAGYRNVAANRRWPLFPPYK